MLCCIQALTESSDLEALRREKRAIIEEERCLKALVDIEKSSGHRKAQMLAALRAEKQRHATKAEHRRKRFTESLERHFQKEAEVLREKHGVPPRLVMNEPRVMIVVVHEQVHHTTTFMGGVSPKCKRAEP